jgi:tRNA A-37 threonylcarbamoyl transferase component Bud32
MAALPALGPGHGRMIQEVVVLSTSKLVIAADWQPTLRRLGLDRFEALWSLGGTIVKSARSTEVLRATLDGRCVFVKKYRVSGPNQLLSAVTRGALFGRSKVRREYENLQQLRQWGFDAPAPVAWAEQRRAGWLVRSLLLTEAVPDATPLDQYILNQPHRLLIERLAEYLRRLHQHNFVHHDLYWRNILLAGNSLEHFYLLDAHKGGPGDPAQDLATLDAPAPWFFRRTERLRFFLRYRAHDRLSGEDKRLVRRLLRLAAAMRERQLRRVREARR